jgi:hypothetical protein
MPAEPTSKSAYLREELVRVISSRLLPVTLTLHGFHKVLGEHNGRREANGKEGRQAYSQSSVLAPDCPSAERQSDLHRHLLSGSTSPKQINTHAHFVQGRRQHTTALSTPSIHPDISWHLHSAHCGLLENPIVNCA